MSSYNDSDVAERPMRLNRHIPSPILSPIPTSPAYYSYREGRDHSSNLRAGAGDAQQRRWRGERDPSRRPPVEPVAGHNSSPRHRTAEDFLSIPRAASSPRTPQAHAGSARSQACAEVDPVTEEQQGAEKCTSDEDLVASRPRPVAGDARERPSSGTKAYRSAAGEDVVSAEPAARTQRVASDSVRSAHDSRRVRGAHRHEDEDSEGCSALSADPENWRSRKSLPAGCVRCNYRLPEELIEYLQETSMYRSVPRPYCPECGARLAPAVRDTRGDGDDSVYDSPRLPPRPSPLRRRESRSKPVSVPQQNSHERRSSSSESSDTDIDVLDAGSSSSDDPKHESQPSREAPPQFSRPKPTAEKSVPPLPPCHPTTPVPPPRGVPPGDTDWTPREKPVMVLAKSPYLTLDSLPCSLDYVTRAAAPSNGRCRGPEGISTLSPDGIAAPWVVGGCIACCRQAGAGLAGICCCAMPCVLFRERQQLLLHKLRSRYICCAGAFPCCVPPASLRPELYYTIGPDYLYSPALYAAAGRYWDGVLDASTAVSQQRHWHGLYTASNDKGEGRVTSSHLAGGGRAPLATFRSVNGVASPASLVSPRTGLPLDGCYSNVPFYQSGRPSTCCATSSAPASVGTGCCGCISCACDSTRGCCLYCAHPTAYCLTCPLCCLCCEMTCCMPCALWANRLLIRQHYHLVPDTAVDGGAVCCYTCCVQCCTCLCTRAHAPTMASAAIDKRISGTATPAASTAEAAASPTSLSCWFQLSTTVAACLAAVCCLCPCAACGLAQQRDQIQRLGYPLVVDVPPEIDMM
ncbi:conserved hypothetical protein [Leishmania infantum JPCM5]|uniref:Uncharacterized protein n=2 Tax=Leishmania infantum TaxID=5671 RepID=A4I0V0_LEIIN|nr:conserved hypothetical protein [Leishmania infantum JPCM5]CAC9491694.1 hypothetical_protein_-_conserved [Leishmania infantum]CAM68374.1 conserved hypothetical protein [Leishmania infantum JPCM5]SUZ42195.1 hypothetical_protein_-_conserved [Leishmania infantum]|eukprot:XP_001465941.1 conserved hypothetical protein [Leishmania infantum JPCM5]